jgi:hypothetical protein
LKSSIRPEDQHVGSRCLVVPAPALNRGRIEQPKTADFGIKIVPKRSSGTHCRFERTAPARLTIHSLTFGKCRAFFRQVPIAAMKCDRNATLTKFQKPLFPKLEMKSLSSARTTRCWSGNALSQKQQPENFGRATPHKDDAAVPLANCRIRDGRRRLIKTY